MANTVQGNDLSEAQSLSAWLPSPLFGVRALLILLFLGSLDGAVQVLWGSWLSNLNATIVVLGANLVCWVFLLLPRRFTMNEKGLYLWWLKSRILRFDEVNSASASRGTFGDYLHLTLATGEQLTIQTRTKLLPTWLVSSAASSAATAFPVDLVARVIDRRSASGVGRDVHE